MNDAFPRFFWLRQKLSAPGVADCVGATREALAGLPASSFIRAGMSVAVGAGSRGIANYDVIVRTVCDELKRLGAMPFIVPAMGSHGGATAEGQRDILARYGITEQTMAVPVKSSMEVVELGRTGEFIVYQDKHAFSADAIVLVNRIKPHTDFHGPVESGLMKMAAIGLGKQAGARQFHQTGARMHLDKALLAVAREVLRLSKIAFGVGIIENPLHQVARVVAVPAATLEQQEMKLLDEARSLMPRLPFDDVDLLIVDEMGKNISGTGLDTNVVRREAFGGFLAPAPNAVRRIYVRSLHPDSDGNATGVGIADFIHERLYKAIDTRAMWINSITAMNTVNARIPIWFPTDRDALAAALSTTGLADPRRAKALWIKNTLSCQRLLASEAYLQETACRGDLLREGEPAPLAFDERGDLGSVF
ncbi:MAG: nickel-dependent lactate racemase [Verrucomicrobiae bacterium]|nr:nickel-dependent lactate racemase [Verrucomicrobiae bacterium]